THADDDVLNLARLETLSCDFERVGANNRQRREVIYPSWRGHGVAHLARRRVAQLDPNACNHGTGCVCHLTGQFASALRESANAKGHYHEREKNVSPSVAECRFHSISPI